MEWFRKNAPVVSASVAMATALCATTIYIVGSIHGVEMRLSKEMDIRFTKVEERLTAVEKDVAIIKTVLILNGMLPRESMACESPMGPPSPNDLPR